MKKRNGIFNDYCCIEFFLSSVFFERAHLLGFAILPLLMTVTEAHSPHTWDNPFLYLIGGIAIYVFVLLT